MPDLERNARGLLVHPSPTGEAGQAWSSNFADVARTLVRTGQPTATDDAADGHVVGDQWRDSQTGRVWLCQSAALGAAAWRELPVLNDAGELLGPVIAQAEPLADLQQSTPLPGQLLYDTDANTLRVGDGATAAGRVVAAPLGRYAWDLSHYPPFAAPVAPTGSNFEPWPDADINIPLAVGSVWQWEFSGAYGITGDPSPHPMDIRLFGGADGFTDLRENVSTLLLEGDAPELLGGHPSGYRLLSFVSDAFHRFTAFGTARVTGSGVSIQPQCRNFGDSTVAVRALLTMQQIA